MSTGKSAITIYNEVEYFADLIKRVKLAKAGDRVVIISMTFEPSEEVVLTLTQELIQAVKREASVLLCIDAYSFLTNAKSMPTGPFFTRGHLGASLGKHYSAKLSLLNELEVAGGKYAIVNIPRRRLSNPVAGRSHMKISIVNDYVYIGGCNLGRCWQVDYMAGWQDKKTAGWLSKLLSDVVRSGSCREALKAQDTLLKVSDKMTILVDAGKRNQSIILKNALEAINEAEEYVLLTCQFFPNSVTAAALAKASKRGVRVEIYYNHPTQQGKIGTPAQRLVIWQEKLARPKVLFAEQLPKQARRIHAKLLITEKQLMMGSHNYVTAGVKLGTAEIAFKYNDPQLAQRVMKKIKFDMNVLNN